MSTSGDGLLDDDTARAINTGRAAAGGALRTVQKHLQKVFIVFVIGFFATFYAMRLFIWPDLKAIITSRTSELVTSQIKFLATTPFDVVLLQAKVGIVGGIIVATPVLLFLARHTIRDQHWYPEERLSIWKLLPVLLLAGVLFVSGLSYGYYLFFPFMFEFLAENASGAGILPEYGIVEFTEFVLVLLLSFGLAAELPLAMSGLGYTGIVRYETFRDKWRYAVVGIFAFGALFSPPDPFTQIMWSAPLLLLYVMSLYLTKFVVAAKRGREQGGFRPMIRAKWGPLLGITLVAAAAVYAFFAYGALDYVNARLHLLPVLGLSESFRLTPLAPIESYGVSRSAAVLLVSAAAGLAAGLVALLSFVFTSIDATTPVDPDAMGDPSAIDVDALDAVGVRAAPIEVFAEMDESEALGHAGTAMENDDPEKAQAILDRYDEAESAREAEAEETEEAAETEATADGEIRPADGDEGGSENVMQSTAAGMANAFTEDETTEDDIGGYYYDITFILESLTSKMFRIVGVFMIILAGSFFWLQQGGLGEIRADFLDRIPDAVLSEQTLELVALHPVEALVFAVKVSTILAVISVLPMVLYYAWPAVQERGFASRAGERKTFFFWGIALVLGLVGGTYIGYTIVAPEIISYLVYDQIQANMLIKYRLKNFFWLVIMTTAGVGVLFDVPITMLLFDAGNIVSYATFRNRWREIATAVFAFSGILTPDSLYTMFLVAVPVMLFYGVGLALLWVVTLGGRRGGGRSAPADPASD